jgi:hypothetical protein
MSDGRQPLSDEGVPMDQPTQAVPEPPPGALPGPPPAARPRDPLAVAVANASLLGIGYLLLGRRQLAAVAVLITAVLVAMLATVNRTLWFEILVLAWWVAQIAHG